MMTEEARRSMGYQGAPSLEPSSIESQLKHNREASILSDQQLKKQLNDRYIELKTLDNS